MVHLNSFVVIRHDSLFSRVLAFSTSYPFFHPSPSYIQPSTDTPLHSALLAAAFSNTTTARHAHCYGLSPLLLFLIMVFSRGQMAAAAVTRVFTLSNQTRLQIKLGDLTKAAVGAIVNAANERMLGGGGVDGAIHRAAGPRLYDACKAVPEITPGVRCPTGEARITPGFELPASFVVHTVGPVYKNDFDSAPLLRASHQSTLELAARQGVASVAFPAISCGIYGYPVSKAARIAVQTCLDFIREQVSKGEGGGSRQCT